MDGPAWPYERQSLVKLHHRWPVMRTSGTSWSLCGTGFYTGHPFDFAAVRAIREQQLQNLVPAREHSTRSSAPVDP